MNKAALFAVIASGFLLSSFHHPEGQATFASRSAGELPVVQAPRSISSEAVTQPQEPQSEVSKVNIEDPAAVLN